MERHRQNEREHVTPALGRRRRIRRVEALNRLGREIGLGQQRGGQPAIPLATAFCVSLAESLISGQWPNWSLCRAPRIRVCPSPMNRRGGGGEAPPSLTAEVEANPVAPPRAPRALVFDSGLGGLSVLAEIRRLRPDVEIVYAADDAAFPYGRLSEAALVARVAEVMARLIGETEPDIVVIACSTASTLALPPLRAAYPGLPFVGTVPAIKPAAAASRSRLISVLATRGTVARDYTHALVRDHAADCEVTLVGSPTARRPRRAGHARRND